MGWPFSTASAPTFDSGTVEVPEILTDVPDVPFHTTPLWLMGAHFNNKSNTDQSVEIFDGAGISQMRIEIAAGVNFPLEWPFRPITGLQWIASGPNFLVHLWGYR